MIDIKIYIFLKNKNMWSTEMYKIEKFIQSKEKE
jgi:hypothetical protein